MIGTITFLRRMYRNNKNIRIIFEGHYLTMKSSLVQHFSSRYNIPYLSGEWLISDYFGANSHIPNLIVPGKLSSGRVHDAYHVIIDMLGLFPYQPFLIDRFHISLQFYDQILKTNYYAPFIEDRLLEMNTVVVFCLNQFDNYDELLASRLQNNLDKKNIYPTTLDAYLHEEHIFKDIIDKSKLPIIELQVNKKDLATLETEIIEELNKLT